MIHWAVKYIGKPWINGEYDCWGLVREIYKNELQIALSPIVTDATSLRDVFASSENRLIITIYKKLLILRIKTLLF